VTYPGPGAGPFIFPFRIQRADDLSVIRRSADGLEYGLINGVDYLVAGVLSSAGSVTLNNALVSGEILVIRRQPPLTQETSSRNAGVNLPNTHADTFDRFTMQLQAIQEQLDRAVKLKRTRTALSSDVEIEPSIGKVLTSTTDGFTLSTLDAGAVALPGTGRTVPTLSAYLANNAALNVRDFGATGNGVTDDTGAIRAAFAALPAPGGMVLFPQGHYKVSASITTPDDTGTTGQTVSIVGIGEARLHNVAPPNNPTFKVFGTSSGNPTRGIRMEGLILTNDAAFPNNGIHLRHVWNCSFRHMVINMNGNGIYNDGGVAACKFEDLTFWPTARTHGTTSDGVIRSAILLDERSIDIAAWSGGTAYVAGDMVRRGGVTYIANVRSTNRVPPDAAYWDVWNSFMHTNTFDDIYIERGGRGVQLRPFYTSYGNKVGRVLAEGLTGGDGWAVDLDSPRGWQIGPIYSEHNTPGKIGDANDRYIRLSGARNCTVIGGDGSGLFRVASSSDCIFIGIRCNGFDADATNSRLALINLQYGRTGGAGAFYTNDSIDRTEINVNSASAFHSPSLHSIRSASGILRGVTRVTVMYPVASFQPGRYFVSCYVPNGGVALMASGDFIWDGANGELRNVINGASITLSYLADTGLSVSQSTGVARDVTWSVLRQSA